MAARAPLLCHPCAPSHPPPGPPFLPAVLSDPLAFSWPDGRKRAAYHDVRWNEPLGLLYGAGKDKLIDMYTLA